MPNGTAWAKPADDIRKLVRRDYVKSLRRHLPYRELKALTGAFERLLPGFNRETVGTNLMSVESLAEKAERSSCISKPRLTRVTRACHLEASTLRAARVCSSGL